MHEAQRGWQPVGGSARRARSARPLVTDRLALACLPHAPGRPLATPTSWSRPREARGRGRRANRLGSHEGLVALVRCCMCCMLHVLHVPAGALYRHHFPASCTPSTTPPAMKRALPLLALLATLLAGGRAAMAPFRTDLFAACQRGPLWMSGVSGAATEGRGGAGRGRDPARWRRVAPASDPSPTGSRRCCRASGARARAPIGSPQVARGRGGDDVRGADSKT